MSCQSGQLVAFKGVHDVVSNSGVCAGAGSENDFLVTGGTGEIQNMGYLRWMLFSSNATTSTSVLDSNTTGTKYHESSNMLSSMVGRIEVAPAGGWVVPVTAMATTVVAHEIDAESQRS